MKIGYILMLLLGLLIGVFAGKYMQRRSDDQLIDKVMSQRNMVLGIAPTPSQANPGDNTNPGGNINPEKK